MSYFSLKRFFDFLAAFFFLFLVFPLILTSLCFVLLILKEGPLFAQKRMGKHGRTFFIHKIKSVKTGDIKPSSHGFIKFLRASGVDELPQLWNVLKGEMSFVGPRPLPIAYRELIKPDHMVRETVHPGITGLAQVSGGNSLNWQQRFDLDASYVSRISFLLDLMILFKTFKVILSKRDTTSVILSADY